MYELLLTLIAIQFLTTHAFDFQASITEGVQYLSRKELSEARTKMIQHEAAKMRQSYSNFDERDFKLINHVRSTIKNWLDDPGLQRDDYVNIPGEDWDQDATFTRAQMRVTHQVVRNDFSGLSSIGMKHFVRITAPDEEQRAKIKDKQTSDRETQLSNAIGFRWLIEAIAGGNISTMPSALVSAGLPGIDLKGLTPSAFLEQLQVKIRSRNRVVVGHNCFTDLVNIYACFIGTLPQKVEDFVQELRLYFPAVIDTKHLASFGDKRYSNTSLQAVEQSLQGEKLPSITIPRDFGRYFHNASHHEAGYDSLCTANIAIRLSAKLMREGGYLEFIKDSHVLDLASQFGKEDDDYVTAQEDEALAAGFERLTTSEKKVSTRTDTNGAASSSKPIPQAVAIKKTVGSNLFGLLESGPEAQMPAPSAGSSDGTAGTSSKSRIKKGEIMPRWCDNTGFWKLFGNKLQVNGCKEGLCELD